MVRSIALKRPTEKELLGGEDAKTTTQLKKEKMTPLSSFFFFFFHENELSEEGKAWKLKVQQAPSDRLPVYVLIMHHAHLSGFSFFGDKRADTLASKHTQRLTREENDHKRGLSERETKRTHTTQKNRRQKNVSSEKLKLLSMLFHYYRSLFNCLTSQSQSHSLGVAPNIANTPKYTEKDTHTQKGKKSWAPTFW